MRTLPGLHFVHDDEPDVEEALRIAGPDGCVTFLDSALPKYARWRQLAGPGVLFHVRFYTDNWYAKDPIHWAQECVDRVTQSGQPWLDDPNTVYSLCNEPDLANEGHPDAAIEGRSWVARETYEYIWWWQFRALAEFRRLVPKAYLGTTPLAGGHDIPNCPPDYEFQLAEFRDCVGLADILIGHAYIDKSGIGATPDSDGYWHGLRLLRPAGFRENVQGYPPVGGIPDPGGLAMQYPTKRFLVSEFGNWRHNQTDGDTAVRTLEQFRAVYRNYAQNGRCLGITPFVWWAGEEHAANVIRPNWTLIRGLQDMEKIPAAEWPPEEGVIPVPEDKIDMLLQQNALIVGALIDFRHGRFEGATGVDGKIVQLLGGLDKLPEDWNPSYPPKV